MKYNIEFGYHNGGKWVAGLILERDNFDDAKDMMNIISTEINADQEYHINENTNVKMFDDDKQPHLYHYVSAYYPELSLPSYKGN